MTAGGIAVLPRVVSLFSGAGGLDLGFVESGFEVAYAVDISESAIQTHRRNFPSVPSLAADLTELRAEGLLRQLETVLVPGESIAVIGGPPCQGFSRANVAARSDDPRNVLPMLYLEIIEGMMRTYDVKFVLFENVLGIRDRKHAASFNGILHKLESLNLHARVDEYLAADFGVPQNRRRIIVSAFQSAALLEGFKPSRVAGPARTVRDAIAGLPEPTFYSRSVAPGDISPHPNHWTMRPISKKFSEQAAISSGRSFRRLIWDSPSPTVAYGHREIHVHPEGHRRLSILEAMRLQGFPDTFVLEGSLSAQVEQVSNAVPPPLAKALAGAVAAVL